MNDKQIIVSYEPVENKHCVTILLYRDRSKKVDVFDRSDKDALTELVNGLKKFVAHVSENTSINMNLQGHIFSTLSFVAKTVWTSGKTVFTVNTQYGHVEMEILNDADTVDQLREMASVYEHVLTKISG